MGLGEGMMSAYVYVLASFSVSPPRSYVGWTLDVERRLAEHNSGRGPGAKSTRGHVWSVIYVERHPDRSAAMSREWHLKRDRRLRALLLRGAAEAR